MNATEQRPAWVVRWTNPDGTPGRRSFGTEAAARARAARLAGDGMPVVVARELVPVTYSPTLGRVFSVRARRAGA